MCSLNLKLNWQSLDLQLFSSVIWQQRIPINITCRANEKAVSQKNKAVTANHIFLATKSLGFEEFSPYLTQYFKG